jgi:hypothetical protein
MSSFGEVRKIEPGGTPNSRYVSFWDSRSSAKALDSIAKNPNFGSGRLVGALDWDEGQQPVPTNQ